MLVWSWLLCALAAVSVGAGELAQADSWLLMVEAGRDGPGRRITPKSVFIAPSLSSRAEKCPSGFRVNHLGRCVRVVHINHQAQVDLLLKQLQLTHNTHTHRPFAKPEASTGPVHFSLSLEPPDAASVDTTKQPTQSSTEKLPPPSTTAVPPATIVVTKETTESSTLPPTTGSTTEITLVTREIHAKDTVSTTEMPKETTTWEAPLQTSTSTTLGEDFTKMEGSGESTSEGSGWSSTTLEGSGSQTTETTDIAHSFEGSGIGTAESCTSEVPETTTVAMETESDEVPLQPNHMTPSLLLEVLKGVEVKGADEPSTTFKESSDDDDQQVGTVGTKQIKTTEQLPIVEYIDLFIPQKDEEEMANTKETVLIPLDDIQFNISSTENEVSSPAMDKFELLKVENTESAPVLTPMPAKEATQATEPSQLRPHQWPWVQLGDGTPSQIQIESSSAQTTPDNQTNQATLEVQSSSNQPSPGFNPIPFQPSFGYTIQPSQTETIQDFLHSKRPVNNHRLTTPPQWPGSSPVQQTFGGNQHPGFNYEPTQPGFVHRTQSFRNQHHRRPSKPGHRVSTSEQVPKDSREKLFDNWWTETLPFDPTWIRFPDGERTFPDGPKEQQTFRKGSPEVSREQPSGTTAQQPTRFRFPEESVDPAHRPVILKFWSRIPMIRGDSGPKHHFETDEDHWTGP